MVAEGNGASGMEREWVEEWAEEGRVIERRFKFLRDFGRGETESSSSATIAMGRGSSFLMEMLRGLLLPGPLIIVDVASDQVALETV